MALISIAQTESGLLGIWELSESIQKLTESFLFSEEETKEFRKISSEKRKKEYLSVRVLLELMLGRKTSIFYEKTGRPFLSGSSLRISISHSADLAVVLLSENNIGVDTENQERNMNKIARRFLSSEEYEFSESTADPAKTRVILWSAKEALFKCAGLEEIDFAKQIQIEPFVLEQEITFSGVLFSKNEVMRYILRYKTVKNNVIVCCCEENPYPSHLLNKNDA